MSVLSLSRSKARAYGLAVTVLEKVLGGSLIGLMLLDLEGRVCVIPRPGDELAVLDRLGQADWQHMRLIAGEQTR